MRNLLFVVTHKTVNFPQEIYNSPYQIITVGEGTPWREEIWKDNTGDNISAKNSHYCELTAHYWVWKNKATEYDNIGLCHYQRFFTKNGFSVNSKHFLTDQDMNRLMAKYDVVLPQKVYTGHPRVHPQDGFYDAYVRLGELLQEHFPSYAKEYDTVMRSFSGSYYNIFIMRRKWFDMYSTFLFDVLSRFEICCPPTEENKRIYGYLAELLIDTWLRTKKLKVKYLPIAYSMTGKKYQQKWAVRTFLHINAVDFHNLLHLKRKR